LLQLLQSIALALSDSVVLCLQLMPESLFLTINLIDRYLAVRQVTRKNLQLVSVCSQQCCAHSN
jgi:hypothetical protein